MKKLTQNQIDVINSITKTFTKLNLDCKKEKLDIEQNGQPAAKKILESSFLLCVKDKHGNSIFRMPIGYAPQGLINLYEYCIQKNQDIITICQRILNLVNSEEYKGIDTEINPGLDINFSSSPDQRKCLRTLYSNLVHLATIFYSANNYAEIINGDFAKAVMKDVAPKRLNITKQQILAGLLERNISLNYYIKFYNNLKNNLLLVPAFTLTIDKNLEETNSPEQIFNRYGRVSGQYNEAIIKYSDQFKTLHNLFVWFNKEEEEDKEMGQTALSLMGWGHDTKEGIYTDLTVNDVVYGILLQNNFLEQIADETQAVARIIGKLCYNGSSEKTEASRCDLLNAGVCKLAQITIEMKAVVTIMDDYIDLLKSIKNRREQQKNKKQSAMAQTSTPIAAVTKLPTADRALNNQEEKQYKEELRKEEIVRQLNLQAKEDKKAVKTINTLLFGTKAQNPPVTPVTESEKNDKKTIYLGKKEYDLFNNIAQHTPGLHNVRPEELLALAKGLQLDVETDTHVIKIKLCAANAKMRTFHKQHGKNNIDVAILNNFYKFIREEILPTVEVKEKAEQTVSVKPSYSQSLKQ